MKGKTTQNKSELLKVATGSGQPERLSLSESREKLYELFYNNLRVLTATETISMTELARFLGMKSGTRICDLRYGRCKPSTEELIVIAKHYKCEIDTLIYKTVKLNWE